MEALIDRGFGRQTEELSKFPADGTLADLLATFRHDSSKEEFLWAYIEAVTGEKGVHQKEY
ncbi:MAG: hypothetical protein KBC48_00355 [Candidatus Pacebacteria bacterium]|nr:hypothetical protein [Candidatus Paceibacterota bacterium]